MPARHCGQFIGDDISPALTWSPLPEGTKGLVFVLEDLGNPGAVPGIHTIAAFAPAEGGRGNAHRHADGLAAVKANPDHHGRRHGDGNAQLATVRSDE